MFRIKICGLKSAADAVAAATAGADAIGLNFYARSSRFVGDAQAAEIAAALPPGVCKVGLFVNDSPERIRELYERLELDLVQLHGDETPEFIARLPGIPVMKAFRLAPEDGPRVEAFAGACQQAQAPLAAVLIDAFDAAHYGGTGRQADWQGAADLRERMPEMPLILAGGLTPTNVAAAIAAVRPHGVDTASGVEVFSAKDPDLMTAFVRAARAGGVGAS